MRSAMAMTDRMSGISLVPKFKSDKMNGVKMAKLISANNEMDIPIIKFR